MHLDLPLCAKTTARLSFLPHGRVYHLRLRITGQRPTAGGLEPDLHFAPEGGGVLTLRPVSPLSSDPSGSPGWNVLYGLRHDQLLLVAIYPMTRLTLAPWTGPAGVCLDDARSRRGLMILARKTLGLSSGASAQEGA